MINFSKLSSERGFAMIQAMFLVAAISGFGYLLLNRKDQDRVIMQRNQVEISLNMVTRYIEQILSHAPSCSETVFQVTPLNGTITGPNPLPGRPRLGVATGGTLPSIMSGVPRSLTNDTTFYNPRLHLLQNATDPGTILLAPHLTNEIFPGIGIAALNLVNNEVDDVIRVTFRLNPNRERDPVKIAQLKTIAKDFPIIGTTNAAGTRMVFCQLKSAANQTQNNCTELSATWVDGTKRCTVPEYIYKDRDLLPIWQIGATMTSTPQYHATTPSRSCVCRRPAMCDEIFDCCEPLQCPAASYREFRARRTRTAASCTLTVNCYQTPAALMFKAP